MCPYTFAQWVVYYGEEKALQYWADNEVADSNVEPIAVHSREHTRPCPWPWSTSRPAKIQRLDGSAGGRAASNTSVCAQPPATRDAVPANLPEVATTEERIRDAVRKAAEKCDLANRDSVEKICVHLTHLYDLRIIDLTEWPDFFDDMRTDIEVECGRFGKVVDVLVDTTHQTGSVCVVYSNTLDAECCAHHMNRQWFIGKNIWPTTLGLTAISSLSAATCQRNY